MLCCCIKSLINSVEKYVLKSFKYKFRNSPTLASISHHQEKQNPDNKFFQSDTTQERQKSRNSYLVLKN
jgi:hypothetical protein